MHSVPTIAAERSDDVGTWSAVWPSPTRVQGSDCCWCKRSILSSDVA